MEQQLLALYRQMRLLSYQKMFGAIREKSGSLRATEAFSADVVHLLDSPTLSQFAAFLGVSLPNATYKVNQLVDKGYVRKIVSPDDRREVHLQTCGKFERYFDEQGDRLKRAVARLRRTYSAEQMQLAAQMMQELVHSMEEKEDDHGSI